jgi:hypothetical protein
MTEPTRDTPAERDEKAQAVENRRVEKAEIVEEIRVDRAEQLEAEMRAFRREVRLYLTFQALALLLFGVLFVVR